MPKRKKPLVSKMSVEETCVKQEPETELDSHETIDMLYAYQVPIKLEYDKEAQVKTESENVAASVKDESGLYSDHVVKDELVLGPECMQTPATVACSVTSDTSVANREPQDTASMATASQPYIQNHTNKTTHRPPAHSLQKRHACDICQKEFTRKDLLKIHKRTHTGEKPYSCEVCNREFAQLGHLKVHAMIHTGQKPYRCETCNRGFRQMCRLKRHEGTYAHAIIKAHEPASNETTDILYSYQVPIKLEIEFSKQAEVKMEPCESVAASVKEEPGLDSDHVLKDELVLEPERIQTTVACIVTSDTSVANREPQDAASTATEQTQVHTASQPYIVNHTNEAPSLQMRYPCDICQKVFARKDLLKIHKRTHTGEKPYSCEVCNREFAQLGHLKVHAMIHTGEKPYPCETCNMGFRQLSSLKRHERTHAGEKPYRCDVCRKRFTRKGHLVKHAHTRHGRGS